MAQLVRGHDGGFHLGHDGPVHMQALQDLFVFLVGGLDPDLGAAQLLDVERDAQGLFHPFAHADDHPVQILHMQGAQDAQTGGVGLVDRIQQLFGQLHTGIGHVDADDRMAHGSQSRGHAQAEFSQTDDADFQSFLCHAGSLSRWRRCRPRGGFGNSRRHGLGRVLSKLSFSGVTPRAAGFPRRHRPFWAAGCAGPAAGRAAPHDRRTC